MYRATHGGFQRSAGRKPARNIAPAYHPNRGSYADLMVLQSRLGNQATGRLLKAKGRSSGPTDHWERQADRWAHQALRGEGTLGDASAADAGGSRVPAGAQGTRGIGDPLTPGLRAEFEARFGHDFSGVRIHTDPQATQSAEALNAQAYTAGRNIVFGPGQYAPGRRSGRFLIAHELAHVVQQEQGDGAPGMQYRQEPGAVVAPSGATPRPVGAPVPATGRPSPDPRTRHTVTVVDFGQNANLYNWREVITHIGEIEAQSVDQMVDDVITEVGDPATDCISRLTLVGHGSPGNVSVGAGTGWAAEGNISSGNFRPSIARLTPYFCDGATVVLYACNVGRGPSGARFIQSLSDFWQVNVAAPTGQVDGFGIMGVWVWGQPGQVLPADTALIVDQITRILDASPYGDDEEMIFEL
ncbi:MAG: DUF4157 domain-containing protein, partial [Desulfatitalea sp.]